MYPSTRPKMAAAAAAGSAEIQVGRALIFVVPLTSDEFSPICSEHCRNSP
jgi:hypothetical protein